VHLFGAEVVVDEDLRQVQPHVEDDDVFARSDRRHLPSNFLVAADCRNFDFHDVDADQSNPRTRSEYAWCGGSVVARAPSESDHWKAVGVVHCAEHQRATAVPGTARLSVVWVVVVRT
jgi:hypothetical protein